MRPNGVTGWVPRAALGPLQVVTTRLVIDRRRLRATLTRAGRAIWSSPVGVGAPGTPTPAGHFYIRELLYVGHVDPFYGPWAFGTSAYSATLTDWPGGGVVGIHGTDRPELLPGRPSHGCVRLPDAAVSLLARLMPIGTPVLII
jgi:lipoprotein-anchoring transpeptidase ErfK/SrfK